MRKLKFFDSEQEVIDYLSREMLDTLRDDLNNCTGRDEADTRRDLKAKIHDIESIEDRLTLTEETKPSYKDLVAVLGSAVAEWAYLFPEKFDDNLHEAQSRKNLKHAQQIFKQALGALQAKGR